MCQPLIFNVSGFFKDCTPAMGANEDHASDGDPARVAEAGKTAYFIGVNDVLTKDDRLLLDLETKANANYLVLRNDSQLTDLTPNILAELAGTGKCLKEIEILDRCLRNQKNIPDG